MRRDGPTCLVFSRQGLPHQSRSDEQLANIARGGYILRDCDGTPDAIVIATGSEVSVALEARALLAQEGVPVRVVSMPCWEAFRAQDAAYRESVLPAAITARVSVEAGVTFGWEAFIGLDGVAVGIDRYGASAPGEVLMEQFGFTAENVASRVRQLLG